MILLVLTAILLLTLSGRGFGPLDTVRSSISGVLSPVGDAGRWIVSPVVDAWDAAFDQGDLAARNRQLVEENDRLRGQVTQGQANHRRSRRPYPIPAFFAITGSLGCDGLTF